MLVFTNTTLPTLSSLCVCVCVCVYTVWPIEGDEELTQPSDDEGEVLLSTNPMILRKWLGSVSDYTA